MKKFLLTAFAVVLLSSCSQEKKNESASSDEAVSLFDGKTLNGWRIFKNKPNNSWEVVDGTIHCKPFSDTETNLRSDLITENQYENFEFSFEWKISPQGNSGVIFRVSEDYDETYATGPEYQVLDDMGYPGDLQEAQLTAANYDMHVASNKNLKPVGEWNTGKVVVNGNHVEHWLNGNKVVEYDLYSDDWTARRDASKWKDFPGYATVKKGHIALQDHGNEVWYRNLAIRVIE